MPIIRSYGSSKKKPRLQAPQMVSIPAGSFKMGTSDEEVEYLLLREEWAEEWYDKDLFQIEQPFHTVYLPAYEIARTPVTNAQYFVFVWESGYKVPRGWQGFHYLEEEAENPVVGISYLDAQAYCAWLGRQLAAITGDSPQNYQYRLPAEAEWERAARGDKGDRIYPWGNDFDPWRCNTSEGARGGPTQVGSYSPSGDSPWGIADLCGNVWEWTGTQLKPYPYRPDDGREQDAPQANHVIRGGAWYYTHKLARCCARESAIPTYVSTALGFRVARTITPKDSK